MHSQGALDKLLLCADRGVPLNYVPALLSAASGPITLAGACVVANAEAEPQAAAPAEVEAEAPAEAAAPDIVDTAVADGRFTTLVAAVTAADLVDTLKGEGPFTVFAPTDAAFEALPEGTVAGLLEDIPALTNILLYHVVPGKVMAADVAGLTSATTVQGSDIDIKVMDGTVHIDNATVATADIMTSNGVIHVIDEVILPN